MIDKMMEVPTRNFLDPVTCRCPHPTSHWQSEDGHKEILSHARILIPEKKSNTEALSQDALMFSRS